MKRMIAAALASACIWGGSSAALAEESVKAPLPDVFDRLVVIPYDYQGNVFIHGQKSGISGDYDIAMRNDRVLVPIRLLGTLVNATGDDGYWYVDWTQERPNEVLIRNHERGRSVLFTVGSDTMTVNGETVRIDTAPVKIGGRIMLPLRVAAEAIGQKIDWLDGLILVGNVRADLQHPDTLGIKDLVKSELTDARLPVEDEKRMYPIARVGNDIFYYRIVYSEKGADYILHRTGADGKKARVDLPGRPLLYSAAMFGDELYFVSEGDDGAALYAYDVSSATAKRIAALGSWTSDWGWIGGFRMLGGSLYMTVHHGDHTMGSDTLYRIDEGELTKVASAKSIGSLMLEGGSLYYIDMHPMAGPAGTLYRVGAAGAAEERATLGEDGFSYGVYRDVRSDGTSYSGTGAMFVRDGFIYTLGYRDADPRDKTAVYRISASGEGQEKVTGPAREFWMGADERTLFYIDADTGYLKQVRTDGTEERTLAERRVAQAVERNGTIYYTAVHGNGSRFGTGDLYAYSLAGGREMRLAGPAVRGVASGTSGVYFIVDGYAPGLFKVRQDGSIAAIVRDRIGDLRRGNEEDVLFTLTYKEGVYRAD